MKGKGRKGNPSEEGQLPGKSKTKAKTMAEAKAMTKTWFSTTR